MALDSRHNAPPSRIWWLVVNA